MGTLMERFLYVYYGIEGHTVNTTLMCIFISILLITKSVILPVTHMVLEVVQVEVVSIQLEELCKPEKST